jgi:hypothetical protein
VFDRGRVRDVDMCIGNYGTTDRKRGGGGIGLGVGGEERRRTIGGGVGEEGSRGEEKRR